MVWMALGRPQVFLPADLLATLDDNELNTLLAHELAHLCRRDHWMRWLEFVVQGLYWWNPVVLLARQQLQTHGEECCDALVVQILPARCYASAIIRTLDFLADDVLAVPATASALGRVACMKRRLTRIMHGGVAGRLGVGRLAAGGDGPMSTCSEIGLEPTTSRSQNPQSTAWIVRSFSWGIPMAEW